MRSTRRAALFDLDRTLVRIDTATLARLQQQGRALGRAQALDRMREVLARRDAPS